VPVANDLACWTEMVFVLPALGAAVMVCVTEGQKPKPETAPTDEEAPTGITVSVSTVVVVGMGNVSVIVLTDFADAV